MSELEQRIPQGGEDVFGPQLALIQAAADEHMGTAEEMVGDISNRAMWLGQGHPFFGRLLHIETEEPIVMEQYLEDGTTQPVELEAGRYELTFAGFGVTYEYDADGTEVFPTLQVVLYQEGMDDCAVAVEPERLMHVDLADSTNPFAYDVKSLYDVDDNFQSLKLLYPTADYTSYLDQYTEERLSNETHLIGAEVELLFTDDVEVMVCGHQDIPEWVEYDDEEEAPQSPENNMAPEHPDQTRLHQGLIIGRFLRYTLEEDESDNTPILLAHLQLSPDDPLLEEEPWLRNVAVPAELVSWGRVRSSPRFN